MASRILNDSVHFFAKQIDEYDLETSGAVTFVITFIWLLEFVYIYYMLHTCTYCQESRDLDVQVGYVTLAFINYNIRAQIHE